MGRGFLAGRVGLGLAPAGELEGAASLGGGGFCSWVSPALWHAPRNIVAATANPAARVARLYISPTVLVHNPCA